MRIVRILEEASDEAAASAAWYEKERTGLGAEFLEALEAGLDLIEEGSLPLLPMPGKASTLRGAKRLILKRFPYDIVALEMGSEVFIIAIAHHSRKPGYWQDRVDP